MPQAISSYQKIINKALKLNWTTTPEYDSSFNYDKLLKELNYSVNKVQIGKTHNPETWEEYCKILIEYKKLNKGVTLNRMVFVYGKELGTKKFNDYQEKQALTNSFEYKQQKYGFTEEQFNQYNKSRAVTLENLIKKYGEDEGKIRYKKYCDRQAYTNTLEYLGEERYKKVSKEKSHSLETYIKKYGDELGPIKLIEFYEKISPGNSHSKISQELFKRVEELLTEKEKQFTYYAIKNKEYGLFCRPRVFLYDFVCTDLKFCIEYHGDHYHGNPLIYQPDDFLRGRGCTKIRAKEKWEYDDKKINWLKTERNYDTIIVWDSNWRDNPDVIMEKISNWIIQRRILLLENANECNLR